MYQRYSSAFTLSNINQKLAHLQSGKQLSSRPCVKYPEVVMDGSLSDLVKTFPTHACQVYLAPCYEWISWQMLWLRGLRRTNERAEAPAGPVPFRKCFSSNCRHLQEMAWHKRGLLSRCCYPRLKTVRWINPESHKLLCAEGDFCAQDQGDISPPYTHTPTHKWWETSERDTQVL